MARVRDFGQFRSHHGLDDTRNIVIAALSTQLSRDQIELGSPGILDSIYFSELSGYRVVLSAGNTTRELWNVVVELAATPGFITGHAFVDRKEYEAGGHVNDVLHQLTRMLRAASIDMKRWKY